MTETRLTKEIAETVRAADDLTGFTELDDAAAESLSKHEDYLYLNGLTSLSDADAESLSKHRGDLHFYLHQLPEWTAEILRKHPSYESWNGMPDTT